jgi:pimeloyl-[acyl-carrier protein] methyl ester esterase
MLVLLPGMDGTGALFAPFISYLTEACEVQIVRYPADVFLTYSQLEQHVLDHLPKDVPITLVAESFSGPIALRISERGDLNLQAVVLVCSFASRPLGWIGTLLARFPLGYLFRLPLPTTILRTFLLGGSASRELISAIASAISSVQPFVLAARRREVLTATYCPGHIQPLTRVVVLFSKRDRLIGRRAATSILKVCSTIEAHAIDAPHLALQSAPGEVLKSLVRLGVLDHNGCA